jgi:hypothetical protein
LKQAIDFYMVSEWLSICHVGMRDFNPCMTELPTEPVISGIWGFMWVKMSLLVYWVTPCGPVLRYKQFRGICCTCLPGRAEL